MSTQQPPVAKEQRTVGYRDAPCKSQCELIYSNDRCRLCCRPDRASDSCAVAWRCSRERAYIRKPWRFYGLRFSPERNRASWTDHRIIAGAGSACPAHDSSNDHGLTRIQPSECI